MSNIENETPDRHLFRERLELLADKHGGKAALARLAGLSPTSLQNYFTTATEPPRPVLFALARSGKVSVSWLAGDENVGEDGLPIGFVRLPFYDLSLKKNLVYPLFSANSEWRVFFQDDLVGRASVSSSRPFVVRFHAAGFGDSISADDDLLIDGVLAHDPSVAPEQWQFSLESESIYLIGRGSRAALRKLRKRKNEIEVLDDGDRVDFKVSPAGQDDFLMWGPVVWRGGPALAGSLLKK